MSARPAVKSRRDAVPSQASKYQPVPSGPFQVAQPPKANPLAGKKLVMLVRNAERVDRVFPEWLTVNVDECGRYCPNDLNLPPRMFARPEGPNGYVDDTPITELGRLTGQMLGRSVRVGNTWPIHRIYCSPALRCVQTAAAIVQEGWEAANIFVEPALFDFLGWYKKFPSLLSVADLCRLGFPIATNYKPILAVDELKARVDQETIEALYARVAKSLDRLTNTNEAGRILIVTHATVIDAGIKALKGSKPSLVTQADLYHMGTHYPYCSNVALANNRQEWSHVHDPIPPFTYLGVSNRVNAKFVERTTKPRMRAKSPQKFAGVSFLT
ncbi:ubiquitin associated and SH3 domain-containing protein B [Aphelenchoides avenae]|nr:ubiquitin associated and SH3 domain-containing protein B [Aphelenchus avenae]